MDGNFSGANCFDVDEPPVLNAFTYSSGHCTFEVGLKLVSKEVLSVVLRLYDAFISDSKHSSKSPTSVSSLQASALRDVIDWVDF